MMKLSSRRAFSLVEILVALTIISILAGLSFIGFQRVAESQRKSRTMGEIASFESGLKHFQLDNGAFPESMIPFDEALQMYDPNPNNYKIAANILCTNLIGRDTLTAVPNTTSYIDIKPSQIKGISPEIYLVDPFGKPYGYTSGADAKFNVGFIDLWSTGGTQGRQPSDWESWITNWKQAAALKK